eukprot:757549-Hanusia_phi.AAC.2
MKLSGRKPSSHLWRIGRLRTCLVPADQTSTSTTSLRFSLSPHVLGWVKDAYPCCACFLTPTQ